MVNSRSLNDLHPVVKILCEKHIHNCKQRGVTIAVTSTLRDDEYQATLYAKGRTAPGSVVTNLKVTGAHGLGLAYDVVPLVGGKPEWNDSKLWKIVGEEGIKLGLDWGGNWKSFIDKPHFEYTDKLTFAQLRAGKRPKWFATIEKEAEPVSKPVDVPSTWAKEAVEWAKANKISDGTRPKDVCTREELITMLYNYNKTFGGK